MRRPVLLAVLAAIAVLGVVAFVWVRRARAAAATPRYDTVAVDTGHIESKVTASGTLSALVTVQVGSQVSGRLLDILVDYNSKVTKGEVLAHLDPQLFQAAAAQAQASVKIAQGNVAKAKAQALDAQRQADRAKNLFAQHIITQADLDTAGTTADAAVAAVTVAEGSLDQAEAVLSQAQTNLQYATIYSPNDGIVISRAVDVGQTVAASLQAPVLFTIAEDLRKMQVDTSVAEGDVGKIREGMPATFTVDAYPGATFSGTVRQVRNAAQVVQNVVTYDAVIDVANDDLRLKPGMTANATFIAAQADDVLRVPNTALRFRPPADVVARAGGGDPEPAKKPDATPASDGAAKTDGVAKGDAPAKADGAGDAGKPGADAKPGDAAKSGDHPHGHGGWGGGAGGRGRRASAQRVVWVLRADGPHKVTVTTGITDGSFTEVRGDLTAGDPVIVELLNPPTTSATSGGALFGGAPPPGGMRRF